ncbi:alpha/beta fold hydrolase [Pseudochryseolinea flava]|uniref:Alpha/beta hydrolase n=1 Tax=Pseudochryseolinea flava TaxID=2059302 RepID=A0A364Y5K5_9BACT|nr:alpha/beta hydrolase [Pseudochryseolinea flava]RAW01641.1 alpha/beta hydrolase [Pseudochryseolinea flava]
MITALHGSQLFYHKHGHGPRPLLLFHGFGQTHEVFLPLAEALQRTHTCYLFDLYFHGNSVWKEGEKPIEKSAWEAIIAQFLKENQIDQFDVGGFSLGGKLALAMIESFPDRIQHLYLLASDGIKPSFWYGAATYPFLLRKIFKRMITKPQLFFSVANFLRQMGLIDQLLIRFAASQMNTEEQRERVYYSWVVFRHLTFDMKKIAQVINSRNIDTQIIVGKFDRVIKVKSMRRLTRHLRNPQLIILPTGHNGLLKSWKLSGERKA